MSSKAAIALGVLFVLAALGAKEYDFQRFFSKRWHVNANEVVVLENPVGEIHISNTPAQVGPFVVVKQRIYAAADELILSRRLVMMVRINATRRPDTLRLQTLFPMHMYNYYCYPDMGGFFTPRVEGTWQGHRMIISPRKGVKLWSDIYIQVPRGQSVVVRSIATTLVIEDFEGDLDFATDHASAMTAGDIKGNLFLTACHGALSVSKLSGSLFYDGEDSDLSFCDVIRGKVYAKSTTGDLIWTAKADSLVLLELESLSGKIMFEGDLGEVTKLVNDEGKIRIKPTNHVAESLLATTQGGDIELSAPQNFAAKLEAKTQEGKLSCNIPGARDREVLAQLKGKSGFVSLRSERGDIEVKLKKVR